MSLCRAPDRGPAPPSLLALLLVPALLALAPPPAHAQGPWPVALALPDSSLVAAATPTARGFWVPLREDGALWRGDRLQHLTLSATLVVGSRAGGARNLEAAAGTLALGLAKEALDARRGGRASGVDLAFDVLGIAAGILIAAAAR